MLLARPRAVSFHPSLPGHQTSRSRSGGLGKACPACDYRARSALRCIPLLGAGATRASPFAELWHVAEQSWWFWRRYHATSHCAGQPTSGHQDIRTSGHAQGTRSDMLGRATPASTASIAILTKASHGDNWNRPPALECALPSQACVAGAAWCATRAAGGEPVQRAGWLNAAHADGP